MIAACALVMGALVGIVMPIGDAGIATAQATVQDGAMPDPAPSDTQSEDPTEIADGGDEQPEIDAARPEGTPDPGATEEPQTNIAPPSKAPIPQPLAANPPLSCLAGTVYSVASSGQMQQLVVKDKNVAVSIAGPPPALAANMSRDFNGLGVDSSGTTAYIYNRANTAGWFQPSNSNTVFRFNAATGAWANTGARIDIGQQNANGLVGGAVAPDGTYWAGGFNSSGRSFHLWAMEGNKMVPRGAVLLPALVSGTGSSQGVNGDFAFDTQGNLYIVRGVEKTASVFRLNASLFVGTSGTDEIGGAEAVYSGVSPFERVNGIAYDSDGKLFVASQNAMGYLDRDAAGNSKPSDPLKLPGNSLSTTDLASCSFPPTVSLQKILPDGRALPSDQFRLELKAGTTSLGTKTTTGSAKGLQPDALGPIPLGTGSELTLSEAPANAGTKLENYSVSWECSLGDEVRWSGKTSQGKFTLPPDAAGKAILCTFTNKLMKVTKTADPASGTPVNENGVVNYTLTFDNRDGATAVKVDYRDYVADVLDDATFYNPGTQQRSNTPFVTHKNGVTSEWVAAKQWLNVGGTVAAGAVGTLSFPVKVLPNSAQAGDREASETPQGFFLRNKLARGSSETPPATCEPGLCVEHPINAWSVEKASKPTSGARLHKGGNVHYSVTATKANAETTLNGLVLEDDLTHVFKSAGWAPDAAVPGGAKGRGVYLFDSEGFTLALDGRRNTGDKNKLQAVQAVSEPTQRNIAAQGAPADMRWVVTSGAPINLPKEAVRAEMWFAVVVAESPVGIPDASIWKGQGNAPASGWHFANYATGIATKQQGSQLGVFAPNECVTGVDVPNTSAAPNAAQPVDVSFPQSCRTQHEVSENYFTIRKDAAGAGVQHLADDAAWDPDPTGLWNMVGHEFEIRDTDRATGKATSYPSAKLCRTDYAPDAGWDGTWATPAAAADASRWAFGAEGAAIQQKIVERNNAFPEAKPLPMCGTLYEIASGNQQGRWRSENLSAGDYWLVETKAPNAQSAENATSKAPRPVAGVQRLAQPVPFKIWPEADGPSGEGPEMQGRGQLDVGNGSGGYLDRCNPGQQDPETGEFLPGGTVAERPTACVNPTGYLMLVKDPAPVPLPLTGGLGPWALWGGGGLALLIASVGIVWWRKRRPDVPRHAA